MCMFNKTPNDLSPESNGFGQHKLISSYKSNHVLGEDDGEKFGYNYPIAPADQEGRISSNVIRSQNETEDDMITYLNPEPKILDHNKPMHQFPFLMHSEMSKNSNTVRQA